MKVDVAVIGAGPAGSTLAALLASRGVSVALIERDTFPRDKVCGEFLSYDALPVLDRLGVTDDLERHGSPRIRRCRIVARHRAYEFPLPEASRGVSRLLLDDLLFRSALTRDVQPWEGWSAENVERQSVTLSRDGEQRTIRARAVAGAWGRWGRFDTQLRRAFARDRSHRNFGFKRHYRREQRIANVEQDVIELHSFDRGYLGVNAVEGGLTNICGLVHSSRLAGHRGRWESFVEMLQTEEPSLHAMYSAYGPAQDDFLSSEPVIFRARRAVESGVFMIGDASGIVDPLTGNGMAMAIQCALLAAPLLSRLVGDPGRREDIEREYLHSHAAMFRPRIAWSRRIARLLSHPSLLDHALRIARVNAIGEFLVHRTRADRDAVARLADVFFESGEGRARSAGNPPAGRG